MSNIEKISVSLSPDLAALLKETVADGEYSSSSEIIREALRDWKLHKTIREMEIAELQALWQQGIESGPSRHKDFTALKKEARKRLKH